MYILDTGFFIVSKNYYRDVFPTFWRRMDVAVQNNLISSVDEVRRELAQYGGEQEDLISWITRHNEIFTIPTPPEQSCVRRIFEVEECIGLMRKSAMLTGGPFADPFVIAKAMIQNGTIQNVP